MGNDAFNLNGAILEQRDKMFLSSSIGNAGIDITNINLHRRILTNQALDDTAMAVTAYA